MKLCRARSRRVLEGQTWLCAHSVSRGVPEAFQLAVPAWGVRRAADVSGAELGQRLGERVAAGVALGVVREDRLRRAAALLDKPRSGTTQACGDVGGILAAVQFAVEQAGVVVFDADHDRLADT